MKCKSCGIEASDSARFCQNCGLPLEDDRVPEAKDESRVEAEKASPPAAEESGSPSAQRGAVKKALGVIRWLKSLRGWDAAAVFGGGVAAGLWYGYSSLDPGADSDKITPLLILGIPVVLVLFRAPIDRLLRPIHVIKRKIPRLILIGAGLAAPYFVSHYLYNRGGLIEYEYVRYCIVAGTLASYVIIRNPTRGGRPSR